MWKSSKCRGLSQSSTLRSWTPWFSDLASTKWRIFQILWKGHVTMSQSGIWGFMSSMSCSILVFHGFSSYFQECFLWPHPTCFRRMLEKKDKPRPSVKELIDDPYVQATTWSNCCMVSGLLHILWPFSIFQQYGCRPKGPCLACSIRWPLVCQNDLWRKLKAEFAKVNYFLAKVWRK